ncbi:MAG: hypothetical protein GY839_09900 [candidate division Zixibacteria bacterium]|nr:hypothetical protein [candidate division Zixibacteria bacterium]
MKLVFEDKCNNKQEHKNAKSFIEFVLMLKDNRFDSINIECPDEKSNVPAPDYHLIEPGILIEIKGVHDRQMVEQQAAWGHNISRFEKKVKELDLSGIKGTYIIQTPVKINQTKGKVKEILEILVNAVENNKQKVFISGVGQFIIHHMNEVGQDISFLQMGEAGELNTASIIYQNLNDKILKANNQLNYITNRKKTHKILLLVNNYIFADTYKRYIDALTHSISEIMECRNIDEIWLQHVTNTGKYVHTCLYKKDLLESFYNQDITYMTKNIRLFMKWFYPLSKANDDNKALAYNIIKRIIGEIKPPEIIKDFFIRQEIVKMGEWHAKNGNYDEALWVIDRFIDDPDPEEPDEYSGDPKYNYHQLIKNGEDLGLITTVLGHLAWTIQQITVKKEYIVKALEYTESLLKHENLYVKHQAIIPLLEIAARRRWLPGYGLRPYEKEYKKFHDITFELIEIVEKHPEYIAISRALCRVFKYYQDLSTSETECVLNTLKNTSDSAALFVYHCIYRKNHFKELNIEFDDIAISQMLTDIINDKSYISLRSSIAGQLWRILEDKKDTFDHLEQFVDLFFKQEFDNQLYKNLEMIIESCVEDKPDICINWYKDLLNSILLFISNNPGKYSRGSIWLMSKPEIMNKINNKAPEKVLEVNELLDKLLDKGVM